MSLVLHQHPFASYCWKALIAMGELGVKVELNQVDDEGDWAALAELWPMKKIPVLVDDESGMVLPESTAVIEYLDGLGHAHKLIPRDPEAALQARLWDRIFDGFVMTPMQKIVLDALRPEGESDAYDVAGAREILRSAYAMLDTRLAGTEWAAGGSFTLADCSAAPALHYARAAEPWDDAQFTQLARYYERLLSRPSVAQVVDAAREYRSFFPLGWPEHMD